MVLEFYCMDLKTIKNPVPHYFQWVQDLILLVEVTGIEPATSWSQTTRATNCATPRNKHFSKSTYLIYHKNIYFAIHFSNFFHESTSSIYQEKLKLNKVQQTT